ncbi:uncharacterized protein LOC143010316 [Genypterus blacodes]|uniref:uncharacterized protein LOC143010316 n=1 Tax=Genypterus blacodes TaxID=154954 RepID=UPI003F75E560
MFLLLSYCVFAGVTASEPERHYGLKSSSVCLHRGISSAFVQGSWTFEKTAVAYDSGVTDKYRGKVDHNRQNHSLCINNLTGADSGNYELSFFSNDQQSKEIHTLTVQDHVPCPIIRTSVLSSNLSAGFCNFTVNCSVYGDWVWSLCDEKHCPTSQRSFTKVKITITADNQTITCSGKNHVSESKVSESMEGRCLNEPSPELKEEAKTLKLEGTRLWVIVALSVICLGSVVVFCWIFLTKPKEETAVAPLVQSQIVEASPQNGREDLSSDQIEPEYENVEPDNTDVTPKEEVEPKPLLQTDSIYCFLQLPAAVAKTEKTEEGKEKKGNKTMGEGAAAVTVYSVVNCVQIHSQSTERLFSEASEEASVNTSRDEEVV